MNEQCHRGDDLITRTQQLYQMKTYTALFAAGYALNCELLLKSVNKSIIIYMYMYIYILMHDCEYKTVF